MNFGSLGLIFTCSEVGLVVLGISGFSVLGGGLVGFGASGRIASCLGLI